MSEKHSTPCDCFRPWKGRPLLCGQCGWEEVKHVEPPKKVALPDSGPSRIYASGAADSFSGWVDKHPEYQLRPWDKRNL